MECGRGPHIAGRRFVGGNLALTVALLLRDTDGPPIKGIVSSYPVCDLSLDTPSYQSYGAGGYGLTVEQMKFVWDHYVPHEIDRLHPLAAPLRADLRSPAGASDTTGIGCPAFGRRRYGTEASYRRRSS